MSGSTYPGLADLNRWKYGSPQANQCLQYIDSSCADAFGNYSPVWCFSMATGRVYGSGHCQDTGIQNEACMWGATSDLTCPGSNFKR